MADDEWSKRLEWVEQRMKAAADEIAAGLPEDQREKFRRAWRRHIDAVMAQLEADRFGVDR